MESFYSRMKKIVIFFLIFVIGSLKISLAGEQDIDQRISGELIKIPVGNNRHIYTKSLELSSGEIAYFACEPIIDQDRAKRWSLYRDLTNRMVQYYFYPALVISKEGELNSQIHQIFTNTTDHLDEFLELINGVNDKDKMINAINSIKSGCVGMHTFQGDYVTYISQIPVTSLFPLPENTYDNQGMDLDTYITSYNNLIMSVSSFPLGDINITKLYEHRGIFRNPMSMIRKNYPGVALLLHAFTGLAWSEEFPKVKFMTVEPDGNILMRTLLMDTFNSNEMRVTSLKDYQFDREKYGFYTEKFTPTDQTPILKESLLKYSKSIVIRVEALRSRFPQNEHLYGQNDEGITNQQGLEGWITILNNIAETVKYRVLQYLDV